MRPTLLMLASLSFTGCTVQTTVPKRPLPEPANSVPRTQPTKLVETRYEIREYRDAANPAIRHEAHSIYRKTRVPANVSEAFTTASRTTFPPVSVTPLPPSEELAAEIMTQRKVTAELLALQGALADAEKMMKTQYSGLVRQSAETFKVREQLESERNRLKSLAEPEASPALGTSAATAATEVKW